MKVHILAAALAIWPAVASATTGLAWQLPDEGVRYLIGARIQLPQVIVVLGDANVDSRVSEIRQQVVTTCRPESEAGKKGWNVVCTLDEVSLQAATPGPDEGRAAPILQQWDARLTGATVHFVLLRDGRMRAVDLGGVPKDDRRTSDIAERLRQVVARTFAVFDLELPKKADDGGKAWRQGNPSQFGFLSDRGGMGSGAVSHLVSGSDGAVVGLATEGGGTYASGETVSVGGQDRPANTFEMQMRGTARFDTARGLLVEREYRVDGTATASSVIALAGSAYPYVQIVSMRLLDGDPPELPQTGEVVREEL